MKYFFDTEFIEDGPLVHLVSIGVVSDDGRELYLESSDAPLDRANDFVVEHVLPHLGPADKRISNDDIRRELKTFVGDDDPLFVAWYPTYDWYLVCRLFGGMGELPWRMYCYDLQQHMDSKMAVELPPMPDDQHHALADARWCREAWNFLAGLPWREP